MKSLADALPEIERARESGALVAAGRRREADRRFLVKSPHFRRDRRRLAEIESEAALLASTCRDLTRALAAVEDAATAPAQPATRQLSLAM